MPLSESSSRRYKEVFISAISLWLQMTGWNEIRPVLFLSQWSVNPGNLFFPSKMRRLIAVMVHKSPIMMKILYHGPWRGEASPFSVMKETVYQVYLSEACCAVGWEYLSSTSHLHTFRHA